VHQDQDAYHESRITQGERADAYALSTCLLEKEGGNHTCKITCKKSGLGVLTRTEGVPDDL
jgi:hypothetical protein